MSQIARHTQPITQPRYTGMTGKRRATHGSALNYPRRGREDAKYLKRDAEPRRMLPYVESAARCEWVRRDSPSGRKILVPV